MKIVLSSPLYFTVTRGSGDVSSATQILQRKTCAKPKLHAGFSQEQLYPVED